MLSLSRGAGKAFPGFIDTLVDHLDVAIARVDNTGVKAVQAVREGNMEVLDNVVRENVKYQVQRCQRSAIIQEGIQKRMLLLVGAVYNLDTGKITVIVTKGGNPAMDER
jgi:carbonic anhydrase